MFSGWFGEGDLKCLGEVERCGVEREFFHGRPQVECVSFDLAIGMQTAKNISLQIHREVPCSDLRPRVVVDRAWSPTLVPHASELVESSEFDQYLGDRNPLSQIGIIDKAVGTGLLEGAVLGRSRFRIAGGCCGG